MFDGTTDEISKLIEPGRVHRRVYTDSDIFELEMERIFGRERGLGMNPPARKFVGR